MAIRPLDLYLETGGVRLRYRDEGRGGAVILVHGWTLDLDQWALQARALAGDFRVIRLDRRGFGLSSGVPSITGDGADLSALVAHLGLESAALVGMSQGARAVLEFAKTHPHKTSCVILDGPSHAGSDYATGSSHDIPYLYYRELAQTQGLPAFRREWRRHALARLRTADPDSHALLARMIERYPGRDLTDTSQQTEVTPDAPRFDWVECPALLISGEFDLDSRRQFVRQLAAQLAQVECVEIPNAGHLCNLDNPSAYHGALRRFLGQHAVPSTDH